MIGSHYANPHWGTEYLKTVFDAKGYGSTLHELPSGSVGHGTLPTGFPERRRRVVAAIGKFSRCYGVETIGIDPIPRESRTDTRMFQMFFVWFSANLNILCLGTGAAGPAFFGMGTRQSLVVILVVDVLACTVPALFAVFGPKLGMRSMVQARFSWGYFPACIPAIFNVFSMQGYLVLSCIIGGQTLGSVSTHVDSTLGMIIISLISLAVTFCGYRAIHWYESVAWVPNVVIFIIMLGLGGEHLVDAPPSVSTSTASVVTFATTTAASIISWCTSTPDYGVYHDSEVSSRRIFVYTYLGLFFSTLTSHCLGAALAASAPYVPAWKDGFDDGNSIGGLVEAILSPLGHLGKFLTVLLALTIPAACAPTMYTFSSSFMAVDVLGVGLEQAPRYVYAILSEAILIPVSIIAARRFYNTLVDVLSIVGYWSSVFAAVVLAEHFVIRRGSFSSYNLNAWNVPKKLPPGAAALTSFLCAFGIIIPFMSQAWHTGPIAASKGTGDLGILIGPAVAFVIYLPLRALEKCFYGR